MIVKKHNLEASLQEENRLIQTGKLKEENPLDLSEPFERLCNAVRQGDLKSCHEAIHDGANINGRDRFDYTPLILGSLCGRYEIVQFLLETGALCERDTFQGERCLYNALNDDIRNLLLKYEYSKVSDPLQPLAGHITSLLIRDPSSLFSDIVVSASDRSFQLHKFILSARSAFFRRKLSDAPATTQWKISAALPPQSFEIAIRYLYLGEIPTDVTGGSAFTGHSETEILEGIDRISRQLEIEGLWDVILAGNNRRLVRQQRVQETERGRDQLEGWFKTNILDNKVEVDVEEVDSVKWDRINNIFADILLRADEPEPEHSFNEAKSNGAHTPVNDSRSTIPVGPLSMSSLSAVLPDNKPRRKCTIFPVHRSMLLRADYFQAMLSSPFLESQDTPHLHVVTVDCTPAVLEAVLAFLYTERTAFGLDIALDVLFAADVLMIERLKTKAAQVVSALASGPLASSGRSQGKNGVGQQQPKAVLKAGAGSAEEEDADADDDLIDPFAVLNAAYELRVPRLEEFVARYLAFRLETYIDTAEFTEAVVRSAARIRDRQETDTIELIDDIRYYLSERFRLRFEGAGLEILNEDASEDPWSTAAKPFEDITDLPKPTDSAGLATDDDAAFAAATEAGIREALTAGEFRTLDGEVAGDEFASDAANYQHLLGKIDALLERLQLDD